MRIIGGVYGSRTISMPRGSDIRPTQDKVRQAVFNVLGDLNGARVLDLYAGSGAMGIEAISRGASHATFVDNNTPCLRAVRDNLESLKVREECYDIIRSNADDCIRSLSRAQNRFNLVFLDPPYHAGLAKKTLLNIDACDILAPIGLVVAEHFKKDAMPEAMDTLVPEKEKRYGDVVITIYRKKS